MSKNLYRWRLNKGAVVRSLELYLIVDLNLQRGVGQLPARGFVCVLALMAPTTTRESERESENHHNSEFEITIPTPATEPAPRISENSFSSSYPQSRF